MSHEAFPLLWLALLKADTSMPAEAVVEEAAALGIDGGTPLSAITRSQAMALRDACYAREEQLTRRRRRRRRQGGAA